jgi:hypothetical protein
MPASSKAMPPASTKPLARTGSARLSRPSSRVDAAAVEHRLKARQPKGEMRASDTRIAALMLVLPLFLAAIHQASLGGCAFRPLDTAVPSAEVADAFVRAYRRSVRFAASDRGAYPVPTDVNGGHSTFNEATPTWRIYWGEMARSERLELPTF